MEVMLVLCIALSVFGGAFCNVLPVGKCNLQDSQCMTQEFQNAVSTFMNGVPELGIEVLDVMDMDDVVFDLSGLQFSLKDGKLKGLKTSVFKNVKFDTKKQKISVDSVVNCTIKGHYTAGGRLLILPITGDGQMKLKLRDIEIRIFIDYDIKKGSDGKDRIAPKKLNFDFEVLGNAHFALTNLFNGNKELSDTMLTFLNENWKQVSAEFGQPMLAVAAKKLYKNIIRYFEQSPIEDIAL